MIATRSIHTRRKVHRSVYKPCSMIYPISALEQDLGTHIPRPKDTIFNSNYIELFIKQVIYKLYTYSDHIFKISVNT